MTSASALKDQFELKVISTVEGLIVIFSTQMATTAFVYLDIYIENE